MPINEFHTTAFIQQLAEVIGTRRMYVLFACNVKIRDSDALATE